MGAYYHFDGPNCLVKTSVLRGSGSAMWCPDAPSGSIHYHVERWNQLFPGYKVPVPSFCRTQQPGGANPIWKPGESGQAPTSGNPPIWGKDTPKNPITGPEPEEPQPGCGPAMSVPEDDRTTSSQFSRTGSASSSGDYGSGVIDQLGQPLVVGMTPLATYASTGKPNFTQETKIDIRDQYQGKAIHSLHEGTGDGILCFHPPELQDYMLHGSGVNPDSRWPTNISEVTVLLHNCGRADSSTGDSTVTRLAFGNPLSGTVKPKSGVYFEYDPSTGTLAIQHTDSSGADDSNGDITWNGTSLVGAGSGDISSGSNLTSGRVVKATDDKQIDTPIDLNLAYTSIDAADDTAQVLAGPGKGLELASPTRIFLDVNGTNEITIEPGNVTINDKLTVNGLIDPTGLELSPVAANPGGAAANTLWLDSGDSNRLKHGAQLVGIVNGSPTSGNFMDWVGGSKRIGDSGYSHASFLKAANNLSELASDDTAIANLVSGATSRVPALTDTFPYNDAGDATGGKATLQQIFDRIDDLNTASLGLSSPIAAFESGGKKTTPQAIFNLVNSLTAETAPAYNDKLPLYDASASQTDAVTIANLLGSSRCVTIDYTGSGSSGKTVTLTGINRAHFIVLSRDASGSGPSGSWPNGGTGTINAKYYADGSNWTEWSLSAPAAGTSQVLTINGTNGAWNSSGITYRLIVVGTPT